MNAFDPVKLTSHKALQMIKWYTACWQACFLHFMYIQ